MKTKYLFLLLALLLPAAARAQFNVGGVVIPGGGSVRSATTTTNSTQSDIAIKGVIAASRAGDWVIIYGGAPITTNDLLKQGVNYLIYPPIVYMEKGTSAQTTGRGIFDDRGIPGATTNTIICLSDIYYCSGTNQALSGNTFVGNASALGAIVSTNTNTKYCFKGKKIYCSNFVNSLQDILNAINHLAGSEDSYYEFDGISTWMPAYLHTNSLGNPTVRTDSASGVQVYSNGCRMVCHGDIAPGPNGTYSIVSTSSDPNINANFYFEGAARLRKKIYFSWTSPNWRAWVKCFEINTAGYSNGVDCVSAYGAGKVYIESQKMAADSGVIINTQPSGGTSNIDVWCRTFKIEASVACTTYADVQAGMLRLDVDTYTNLDNSVTVGMKQNGGSLIVQGGKMFINAQQAFGVNFINGTNELNNFRIINNLVNHAGNNPITNNGTGFMWLDNVRLVGPPLAQAIANGGSPASPVRAVGPVTASNTNSATVTLTINSGWTIDTQITQ